MHSAGGQRDDPVPAHSFTLGLIKKQLFLFMNNLNIKSLLTVIQSYAIERKTDYAILLNGSWGSGKTYFVKETLKNKLDGIKVEVEGKEKTLKVLYISLFGINNTTEIDKKIFLALLPSISDKYSEAGTAMGKVFIEKVSTFINWYTTTDYATEVSSSFLDVISKIDFTTLKNYNNSHFIIFDDLERVKESLIQETLGYINNFTEHENTKILIIADEKELEKTSYSKFKEKTIRYTLEFSPEIKDFIENIPITNRASYFIKERAEEIDDIFRSEGCSNLRTLKFAIDNFSKIYKYSYKLGNPEIVKESINYMLIFTLYMSIKYKNETKDKKSNESKKLIDNLMEDWTDAMLHSLSQLEESETDESEQVKNKIKKRTLDLYSPIHSIYKLIQSGYLDRELYDKELKKYQIDIEDINDRKEVKKILEQLDNITSLDDDKVHPFLDRVISLAQEGYFKTTTHIEILEKILSMPYSLNKRDIEIKFKEGIEKSVILNKFQVGKVMSKYRENPNMQRLIKEISEVSDTTLTKTISEEAKKLLKFLESDLDQFILEIEKPGIFPLLIRQIEPETFIELFLQKSNKEKRQINISLKESYALHTDIGWSLDYGEYRNIYKQKLNKLLVVIDRFLIEDNINSNLLLLNLKKHIETCLKMIINN